MRPLLLLPMVLAAASIPASETALPPYAVLLSIGDALKSALGQNPDLLDSADAYLQARVNERATAASYYPQVTPFFSADSNRATGTSSRTEGVTLGEQFPFGPSLSGTLSLDRDRSTGAWTSSTVISLAQPLARGADPAVAGEPLRQARRAVMQQGIGYETLRRRTVLAIYQSYLRVAEQEQELDIARERLERARRLTSFSRARFLAGSISRLDVLRAEQQEKTAEVAANEAGNGAEDAREFLRRIAGLPRDYAFCVRPPEDLPEAEPDPEEAVASAIEQRPEVAESRAQVVDAEFAVRLARSAELPSLDAVLSWEKNGSGPTARQSLRGDSAFIVGLRSEYGLNPFRLAANRRVAEIALAARKRDAQLLEDDVVREVRQAYRRLETASRNFEIAAESARVAELQARVAGLRFEKGLADNFNVIDAENQWNSARLFELDARYGTLLARLDCLFASSRLEPDRFLAVP